MIQVGDYIRWVSGVAVFAADSKGSVSPVEKTYTYGIVVEIAKAGDIGDDVVIAFSIKESRWFVAEVCDPEYEIELVSKGKHESGEC